MKSEESADDLAVLMSCHYDALGRRVKTVLNGNETRYYYDAAGQVVERYEYGPFGQPTIYAPDATTVRQDASGRPLSAIGNPLLFNGRPYDAETGLYYYRTRYLELIRN